MKLISTFLLIFVLAAILSADSIVALKTCSDGTQVPVTSDCPYSCATGYYWDYTLGYCMPNPGNPGPDPWWWEWCYFFCFTP